MSEFLVMASTLLDIKCKMLLPKEVNEEGVEEDPRDELVQQLLEYKICRYMSTELKDLQIGASKVLFRTAPLPKWITEYKAPVDYDVLLGDMTLEKLNKIFEKNQSENLNLGFMFNEENFPTVSNDATYQLLCNKNSRVSYLEQSILDINNSRFWRLTKPIRILIGKLHH
jgi:chromatin segregation and condensation protein Rec8/ScpA/Scc1 (kleisin family)